MDRPMNGELEAYFNTIGSLGTLTEASDGAGRSLPLADGLAWSIATLGRAKSAKARIYFVGNGGSAAIASHMAIDWMKNGGFAATAFNDGASLTCLANDIGFEQVFALPLSRQARPGDVLIAISSSGRSADILAAVAAARNAGASVLTLSGFAPDNPLRGRGDMNFYVPNKLYGFVEIAHLTICHAMLDLIMGWRADGAEPVYAPAFAGGAT
jgi:D-sedoheptulose 7-phosphate isomerase